MSRLRTYDTLKKTKEFSYVYHNAKKVHTSALLLFYLKSTSSRVGFTASKKVGNAVARNFSKRRMRALFMEYQDSIQEGYYILVAKKDILNLEYSKLQKSIHYALKKVGAYKEK